MPQGSVFGPLFFLVHIAEIPRLLKNVLIGYDEDFSPYCRIPHPRDRAFVAAIIE